MSSRELLCLSRFLRSIPDTCCAQPVKALIRLRLEAGLSVTGHMSCDIITGFACHDSFGLLFITKAFIIISLILYLFKDDSLCHTNDFGTILQNIDILFYALIMVVCTLKKQTCKSIFAVNP